MKITIVGAGGNIGKRLVAEAANRNHHLNLITSKNISDFHLENTNNVKATQVDIFDTQKLAKAFEDSDAVISAYAPPQDNNDLLIEASKSLVEASKKANTRLIAVGGAGSLKVSDDLLLVDAPSFPEAYKAIAKSHLTTLNNVYRPEKELNWTNVSPSAYIFEGERTERFKIAEDHLISNEKNESAISMEDFAVAILNEVNDSKFIKKRFTVGY
ncbi:NAD(P)-dependent oxidoreductase [Flavivirga rizhaonensis]|uniref:NAD-dependent epimerase/dehydratase family protein n=1 Tax=Flavivirga rizhaonensis TaxID=2559571 RepID=A0A4V3P476_9FLAO|nr:NAD(P)H-binding protein [Flavivirga rizhaonensis]TGV00364.1 NAD-dependent epimerase/dehydratase family protein [Flavivirga rizhaonensis]